MPLTFEEAKLRYNPDPDWQPKRDSPEYYEILTLMKHSGATFYKPANKPLEIKDVFKSGAFKHPIDNTKPTAQNTYVSKKDFLSIGPNAEKFINHLKRKVDTVVELPQISVSKATLQALKAKAIDNRKCLSKKEFLIREENREYMRHHMLLNKEI